MVIQATGGQNLELSLNQGMNLPTEAGKSLTKVGANHHTSSSHGKNPPIEVGEILRLVGVGNSNNPNNGTSHVKIDGQLQYHRRVGRTHTRGMLHNPVRLGATTTWFGFLRKLISWMAGHENTIDIHWARRPKSHRTWVSTLCTYHFHSESVNYCEVRQNMEEEP